MKNAGAAALAPAADDATRAIAEAKLWYAQRISAMLLALCVTVHIATMIYAVRGGLSAAEIFSRTRGSAAAGIFYVLFVAAAAIHAPLGLRTILVEWTPFGGRAADAVAIVFALVLACAGLRAVYGLVVPA